MRLFSTDIDGTIYDGPESAEFFTNYWDELQNRLTERPLLALNTGRSLDHTMELVETKQLPHPDYLICGVGTVIYYLAECTMLADFAKTLDRNWDSSVVYDVVSNFEEIELQPEKSQNPHKCSFFYDDAPPEKIEKIVAAIGERNVEVQAIYSSNRDLDFLPTGANKGNAIQWLASHLSLPLGDVIVAGDSGNDARMFAVPDVRGIVVSNAELSLRSAVEHSQAKAFFASRPCSWGVGEGIDHFTSS